MCVQVRVGVCIWLAKFLRMSRPDRTNIKAKPSEALRQRYPSLTPTSAGRCSSARRQLPPNSAFKKKSSSSSKKIDVFQQRSSRSLLANVLDLQDDFLLLNLSSRRQRQEGLVQALRMGFCSLLSLPMFLT